MWCYLLSSSGRAKVRLLIFRHLQCFPDPRVGDELGDGLDEPQMSYYAWAVKKSWCDLDICPCGNVEKRR